MNFLGSLSNLLGISNNTAQQAPAQQAQSAPAPAQLQNPDYNRNIATVLSQAPTQGLATQAPQGQGTEQQIKNLFSNLFQTAPQNALNLLMELMGPFMEMINGSTPTQPAVIASPTPQASAQTSPDLNQILNLIGQANPTPAQTSAPTEQNPQQNLESILQAALSSEQPAAAPAAPAPAPATPNPTVQVAPQATNSQPSQSKTFTQAA
jgi:hypothetical protein